MKPNSRFSTFSPSRKNLCKNGHDDWRITTRSNGGVSRYCIICKREREKRRSQKPEFKAYKKAYLQRPEVKERTKKSIEKYNKSIKGIKHRKAYLQRPEVKERQRQREVSRTPEYRAYKKAYQQRPEVKERQRAYEKLPYVIEARRKYRKLPRSKELIKAYLQRPEVKERQRELSRTPEYMARMKAYGQSEHGKAMRKKYRQTEKYKAYQKKWKDDNVEYIKKKSDYHNKISNPKRLKRFRDRRLLVLNHYSTKSYPICAKCGEKKSEFLHVDHILGVKKQEGVRGASNLINYLLKNDCPDGYQILCGNCNWLKEFTGKKIKYSNNPAAVKARRYYKELKLEVFSHYSGGRPKCKCCGFNNIIGLSVDHIKDRKNAKHPSKYFGPQLYGWLKRNGYPTGFQILCIMCNTAKSNNGICPHQRQEKCLQKIIKENLDSLSDKFDQDLYTISTQSFHAKQEGEGVSFGKTKAFKELRA